MTSIIVVAWDTNRIQRQITSTCLGNISKFTDDYELIFIDQQNKRESLDDRHNLIKIDKYIGLEENIGYSAACNLGFKESNPDYKYVCFVHCDVLVPDNWLSKLIESAEKNKQPVMPAQGRLSRETIKESYTQELLGNDDAGVILMTKEQFKETGGWDERFKTIYMDAAFRIRLPKKHYCTNQVIITHIGAVGYYHDTQFESEAYNREAQVYNDLIKFGIGKEKNYL